MTTPTTAWTREAPASAGSGVAPFVDETYFLDLDGSLWSWVDGDALVAGPTTNWSLLHLPPDIWDEVGP